ncbi:hypothetical protein ACMFMG_007728 [Clarireedia jacksonii]
MSAARCNASLDLIFTKTTTQEQLSVLFVVSMHRHQHACHHPLCFRRAHRRKMAISHKDDKLPRFSSPLLRDSFTQLILPYLRPRMFVSSLEAIIGDSFGQDAVKM